MANEIIRHSRAFSPYFIPNKGGDARSFPGLTAFKGGVSVKGTDVFVIGKKVKCGTDKDIPESTVSITQLERGEILTYLTLANLDSEPVGGIDLEDFSSALVDVVAYGRDSFNGTIEETTWYPKTAIKSLNLNIADPNALIERSYDLTGDNEINLQDDNTFLIYVKNVAPTGTTGSYVISLASPVAVIDPNVSGRYIERVDLTRGDTTTTLAEGTDYTYSNGTHNLTITDADAADVYNVYYTSDSFGTAGDPTTVDSGDPCFLKASYVTVLLSDGIHETELDLLSSLTIDVALNRIDESVIGNDEIVLREISDTPVTVSLTGRVKDSTFAKAFMEKLTLSWGITDVKDFTDNVRVTVLIYDSAAKDNFLMGYQVEQLSFSSDDTDFTANDFGTISLSATSDNLKITTSIGDLTLI